jgi:hypothetical protein
MMEYLDPFTGEEVKKKKRFEVWSVIVVQKANHSEVL